MGDTLTGKEPDVVLTKEERDAWDALLRTHRDEIRTEIFRALFDDVRPAWEEYFRKKDEAGVMFGKPRKAAPRVTEEMMTGMYRALFDDVRPAWEASLARHKRHLGSGSAPLPQHVDIAVGMFQAVFDDVRPAWEEYLEKKAAKEAA